MLYAPLSYVPLLLDTSLFLIPSHTFLPATFLSGGRKDGHPEDPQLQTDTRGRIGHSRFFSYHPIFTSAYQSQIPCFGRIAFFCFGVGRRPCEQNKGMLHALGGHILKLDIVGLPTFIIL